MSGTRLVGALGRDRTYVPAENPTRRKGNGGRGVREGSVHGAGVGVGGGRVRFEEMSGNVDGAGFGDGAGGGSLPGPEPVEQVRTQREMVLEAVEGLRTLLKQGVGMQVADLIQEHVHPEPEVPPPRSPH